MSLFLRPVKKVGLFSNCFGIGIGSSPKRLIGTFDNRCRASRLLQPLNLLPHGEESDQKTPKKFEEISSKSSRLLVDLGFVRPASHGTFTYLNLALRSLEKLTALADVVMEEAGCQKILLPSLVINVFVNY